MHKPKRNKMKTKFTINHHIFGGERTLEQCYENYEENFKQLGWIIDKEMEEVFIIIDKKINLNEGDRVAISGAGICIVDWKCVFVSENFIEYALSEE